ncbi:hypothetical protein AB4Z17_11705 [Paenibacillus sp. TAF43_2]|uniref:hypothetical protein n=1 Tax=Paenibacillus sp. TAF43_2 TaxID=3233069 RepID=UPI003F962E6D
MGRMKERDFKILKERSNDVTPCFFAKEAVRGLVAHAEAIELELKISKEDEEEAVRRFGKAELNIVRLTVNVAQLKRELDESRSDELLATQCADRLSTENDTLKAQLEAKKVVLPKEVAEALDRYVSDGHSHESKRWALFNIIKCDSHALDMPAQLIQRHFDLNYFSLASAIVNGYTVEEPADVRRNDISSIINKWWVTAAPIDDKHSTRLADQILEYIDSTN